ncbi:MULTISPECIES: hypothetical protein [unclassified Virgibacillus]|uniref:hypothetical protein n=1 Tax=unclassified Virgibacillus TaxID=2620237 RepID=UPI00090C2447|nr:MULTISPECIES: hypothetical protein [unclassified Virgibacillus]API92689.1 hypothetical protein BKP57_13265 [Virgibacillus sp. 6R]MBS7428183.1 hypothetical protein [Virgibacillus sp. 19R1-5]
MMDKLELQNDLKALVEQYKVAGMAERNHLEKGRRKLGKQLMSLSDKEHEKKIMDTMAKREMMTYSDVFWLFSVGIGANYILNRLNLKASHVDSVDFSNAKDFYQSQYALRSDKGV